MADLTEDEDKLARIFARGLKYHKDEIAEEEAKAKAAEDAAKGSQGDSGNGGDTQPKSWRDRLLG